MKQFLVILLLLLPGFVMAGEIPVRDFFKGAEFTNVSLSPDGQNIAVVIPQADRSTLAVLRVVDHVVDMLRDEDDSILGRARSRRPSCSSSMSITAMFPSSPPVQ